MSEQWFETAKAVPQENVVVHTISPSGHQQKLKRIGKLWFHEDGKMYVYYTPLFWHPAMPEKVNK